jgi:YceI-like protein
LLAACGAPHARRSVPHVPVAPANPPALPGALYRVDSAQSELRVLVYRAGRMALLGHNHVLVNRALGGWVRYSGIASAAAFSLSVPAAGFAVDEAATRLEEGPEFSEDIADEAKSGTLHNLLSTAVLDAAQYPAITLRSVAVRVTGVAFEATVAVSVAGHESTLVVPFVVDESAGRMTASGALTVRQSGIGLVPFSVLMGALRVQDDLQVKFKLVAVSP